MNITICYRTVPTQIVGTAFAVETRTAYIFVARKAFYFGHVLKKVYQVLILCLLLKVGEGVSLHAHVMQSDWAISQLTSGQTIQIIAWKVTYGAGCYNS